MTLILIFDALEAGNIKLTDEVTVSEYAASMGGSQVFLEAGEVQTVDTMIKCIAVASANDACVSMAEFIGGTEDAFVEKMNERAKGLGMVNTHFVNCCGLDTDGHVSSAMDVAIMSRELITKYPQIHDYSTIWMDTITHNTRRGSTEFGLTNTNKLIKQYQWATGLKTGSTSKAGCCLSATATKDGIDLIAVVMTAPDSKTRFSEAISLLNYGFANCYIYMDDEDFVIEPVGVTGGNKSSVAANPEKTFSYMFMSKPDTDKITRRFELTDGISAPIVCGDIVGEIVYEYEGRELGRVSILAAEDVAKAQFSDAIKKVFAEFFD
jgi:D-alanyl-D-alanine carboxypeptidase (penicillin-binding protein 5/6)